MNPAERARECGLETAASEGCVGKAALPALDEHLGDDGSRLREHAAQVGEEPRLHLVVVETGERSGAARGSVDHEAAALMSGSAPRAEDVRRVEEHAELPSWRCRSEEHTSELQSQSNLL